MFGAAHRSAGISLQRGGRRRDREMFRRGARCLIVCNGLRALTERNGTFARPAGTIHTAATELAPAGEDEHGRI